MAEFLLEIGCEEIPAPWLVDLEKQLSKQLERLLTESGLKPALSGSASTPRRLIATFDVASRQDDREVKVFGPSLKQARDAQGNWTAAALGFAKKNAVDPNTLKVGPKDPTKPAEQNLLVVQHVLGQPAVEVLPAVIAAALRALNFPKRMSWDARLDDGKGVFPFGRPIRWIVALLDAEVVPFTIYGAIDESRGQLVVKSDRLSRGHRFLGPSAGQPIAVSSLDDLREKLGAGFVIIQRQDRTDRIESGLGAQGVVLDGLEGAAMLDRVRAEWPDLVEHPTVVVGQVASEFEALPEEVRNTVLVHHQKYLPFTDPKGRLRFAAITNGDGTNAGEIVRGMERVVVARLRDARFFYDEDQKTSMEEMAKRLSGVTFFQGLGTYAEKANRVDRLLLTMAAQDLLDGDEAPLARRAARLAKADLTSLMVGEFPELQGIMGSLYLQAEGEDPSVVHAVRWQYEGWPPSGPRDAVTAAVGLADRLDTLAAHFSIGSIPSGSRDPYGLRRAATDVILALLEYWPGPKTPSGIEKWPNVHELVDAAVEAVAALARRPTAETASDLKAFLAERLRYALILKGQATGGWTTDEVEAVLGARDPDPLKDVRECLHRLTALHAVRQTAADDFVALATAFKRINNILKQGKYAAPWEYDRQLLTDPVEKELLSALRDVRGTLLSDRVTKEDTDYYVAYLKQLATLRPSVDRFFGDGRSSGAVMVMVDDPKLRRARLGLLGDLVEPFYRVADISKLGGQA